MREVYEGVPTTVTFRVYAPTHAILKVLAENEGIKMVELMDRLVREEAERQGYVLREVRPAPPIEGVRKEIAIPAR